MPDKQSHALLELQSDVLKAVVLGTSIKEVAERVCRGAEGLAPGVLCTVLTVDRRGLLHPLAAPSLPERYSSAIEGIVIGPSVGSCGTAAFRREEVVVTDIMSDPLWAPYKALAESVGVRACWSSPILDDEGEVIATFAFYWRECRGPSDIERRIVGTCVDVLSIAIRHAEARAEISQLAFQDRLTSLPNRRAFEDFASTCLADRRANEVVGIHYVDLDDFKSVNDTLGHKVGDQLLAATAARFAAVVPRGAMVARLGGDEFAVCAVSASVNEQAAIAEGIVAAMRQPVTVDGHDLTIGTSLGLACAPRDGGDLDRLSQRADMALYAAKGAGRNTYRMVSREMADSFEQRGLLKADLAVAADRNELRVVYQPIVDLATGRVKGFEALLRWQHPQHGNIPPDRFIPMAEEAGTINLLGAFVLRQALADASRWPQDVGVSINVSPVQLEDPLFASHVALQLVRSNVTPWRLIVEVTETALLGRNATTLKTLDDLKTLGVDIALDDFGTGYSSLSLIRDRRFSRLKIDKSFVDGLGVDPDCEAIVRSTLNIARETGFRTTAEGIETHEQLNWLARNGCDEGQGYVLSRPIPAAEVPHYLGIVVDKCRSA